MTTPLLIAAVVAAGALPFVVQAVGLAGVVAGVSWKRGQDHAKAAYEAYRGRPGLPALLVYAARFLDVVVVRNVHVGRIGLARGAL
jgi:hypothetical protein